MASLSVAAIVVSHGKAEYLAQSLEALAVQTHPLEQVVVVETAADAECLELASSFGFSAISPGDLRLGEAINSGIASLRSTPGWIWIIHDDAIAEPDALTNLARAAEVSPSVALIGPKLLELDNPIQIQQMGLTATKTGKPFLLVQKEYDQGQHDRAGDTLSVSTAGVLVSLGVWQQLGGLDDDSPVLAQDLELGLRARAAGYRVIVEATARVKHAGLSLRGKRPRRWLGGSVQQALSKAHIHTALLLLPTWLLAPLILFMPALVVASAPVHILRKQPGRILGQLLGWLWTWGTLPARLQARSRFKKDGDTKSLRSLMATPKQIRSRRRASLEFESPEANESLPGLFRSGAIWWALVPLLLSYRFFPSGTLVSGGYPAMGQDFASVYDAVSLSKLPALDGLEFPSDPAAWFALLMAALSPANPSLGFAWAVFLALPIAFLGAWQFGKLFIAKPWVISLIALGYSLSPQLLALQQQFLYLELLASAIVPWVLYFQAQVATSFSAARAWRWLGLAGLSAAILYTLSPVSFGFAVLTSLLFGLAHPRRLGILIWMALPGLALGWPWVLHAVEVGDLGLLAESSVFGSVGASNVLTDAIVLGLLLIPAALSWIKAPVRKALPLWVAILAALAIGLIPIAQVTQLSMILSLLPLLVLAGMALSAIGSRAAGAIAGSILAVGVGSSAVLFSISNPASVEFSAERLLPALVTAASNQDPNIRTLVIDSSDGLSAAYVWGAGETFERSSLLARNHQGSTQFRQQIADATANLVAGNQSGFENALSGLRIDFVLLQGEQPELKVAIDSISSLQPAGESNFGSLWKVENSFQGDTPSIETYEHKNLQLATLAVFALLAVPTPAAIRGSRRVRKAKK